MQSNFNQIDRLAIGLGSALVLLGIVVMGVVELLDGPPFGAAPLTSEAGEVVATPLVDPSLRTGLVLLGLLVLLLWGLYRVAVPSIEIEESRTDAVVS